jgi:hypothetical protein
MRRYFFLGLLALAFATTDPARGQNVAQEFSGSGATTTALFTVGDRWEVRWNAQKAISIAAMASDGTIVAGASGVLRGSLFVPAGGRYYLKISDGTAAASPATNAAPAVNPGPSLEIVPDGAAPAAPEMSWHVKVIQLAPRAASTDALTVFTPYFIVPESAVLPTVAKPPPPPPPAPPPPALTAEQLRSLVTIKGDTAEGNGFLVRAHDSACVACNLHLLAANPNIQIFTSTGAPVKILSVKAATDRDLALIAVRDDHFDGLPLPGKGDEAPAAGDPVLIPAVGDITALAGIAGGIVDFSGDRIHFDNPIGAGSNGAPIVRVKSGAALGIVTPERRSDLSGVIAKAWRQDPVSAAAYYGVPLRNVAGWEPLDLTRFAAESAFLQNFHDTTRALDSYLNGRRRRHFGPALPDGAPDGSYYTHNRQITAAANTYRKSMGDSDSPPSLDAARELLFDLQAVADAKVDQLENSTPAYAYDLRRMREELAYRKAIKKELEALSDDIPRLDSIAQMH